MAAVNNEGFSSLGTPTGSLTDITDGSDAVHTGIVKALNRMATGNTALSGFDISAVTSNSITFGNGNVLKDGELTAITGATVTIGVSDRVDGAYHLIIVSGTTLGYRVGAANIVADYNDGDVIIGVGKYVNSSTNMQFQYLTGQKTKNSISIAYDNSGTYTEAGKISGDANGILITGTSDVTLDGANDRVYVKDATDNTLKTVTPQSIADLASGYTDGDAVAAIEAESGIDFSTASSDAIIQNTVLDKDIIFRVNDGGSNVDRLILYGDNDPSFPNTEVKLEGSLLATEEVRCNGIYLGYGNTPLTGTADIITYSNSEPLVFKTGVGSLERMRIDTAGQVGIGTDAPNAALHVRGSTSPTVRIQEDGENGYLDIVGISDSQSSIKAVNDTASEVAILDITSKCAATGTGQEVRIFRDAATTSDGTFSLKQPGTNTNAFKFTCDKDGTDHQFIADGDVKIGGTSSPTVALDVTGEFRLSSHAELNGDLDHDGTNIGFFGTAPAAQQSVGNLGASGIQPKPAPDPTNEPGFHPLVDAYVGSLENEINTLRTKLDTLIDALQLYGIVT